MIGAYIMGGLGNFMFQIATAYNLAVQHNDECVILDTPFVTAHGKINTYQNNLLRKIKFVNKLNGRIYTEKHFNYHPIAYHPDMILHGYFQSERYFDRKTIIELYQMDERSHELIRTRFGELLNEECVSIHVRRGDYVHKQDRHPVQPVDFYYNAISHFNKTTKFLVMSDDINWCKQNFKGPNFTFIENYPDYIDMNIMRVCQHNIISNSTFSWWGAWLNENPIKKIISPINWFGPKKKNFNTNDLIPQSWIQI